MSDASSGVRLRLALPAGALEIFEAGLLRLGGAVATAVPDERGTVAVEAYLAKAPDPVEVGAMLAAASAAAQVPVPDVTFEPLPAVDWVRLVLGKLTCGPRARAYARKARWVREHSSVTRDDRCQNKTRPAQIRGGRGPRFRRGP